MKTPFEILIPFLLTGLLLFVPYAHAEDDSIININIDVQGIINAVNGIGSGISGTINSIPSQVLGVFGDAFKGSLVGFNDPLMQLSQTLLTSNPDPSGLYGWWQSMVIVISSFYLLIFLFVGLLFLFSALNLEKRMEAKEWLKNAFTMIILVNLSFVIYGLILELATAITQYMWISGFQNFFDTSALSEMSAATLLIYGLAVLLTAITLFVRHIFLLIGVVLFPLAIFLYYVPPLQSWGRMILNLIGFALFMQFLDVVIFVASNQTMQQLTGNAGQSFVPALAFIIIFLLNLLLMFYAGLKSVFTATENSKVLGFAIGAMTGQIAGAIASLKTIGSPPTPSKEIKV
ncbi:MAG: hypothetical protein V1776_01715 [Candidatus Diapherotrites archaeon]